MFDPWSIIGPIMGAYGGLTSTMVGYLLRRDTVREARMDHIFDQQTEKVIPALERSTSLLQTIPPLLTENTKATDSMHSMLDELGKVMAVIADRQRHPQ